MSRFFRLPLQMLPSVRLEDCDRLPRSPGVYYAIDPTSSKPLYVGMAGDMRSRWRDHHQYDRLARRGSVRLHYRKTLTRSGAEYLESCEIRHFDPPMNDRFETCPLAPVFWVCDRLWDCLIGFGIFLSGCVLMSVWSSTAKTTTAPTIEVKQLANVRKTPNGLVLCRVQKGDRLPLVLASGETVEQARSTDWIRVKACGGSGLVFKDMVQNGKS